MPLHALLTSTALDSATTTANSSANMGHSTATTTGKTCMIALGIPELAENILLQLDPKTILAARGTCRALRETYYGSNKLKTITFENDTPDWKMLYDVVGAESFEAGNVWGGFHPLLCPPDTCNGTGSLETDEFTPNADLPYAYSKIKYPCHGSPEGVQAGGKINMLPERTILDLDILVEGYPLIPEDATPNWTHGFFAYPLLPTEVTFHFHPDESQAALGRGMAKGQRVQGRFRVTFSMLPGRIHQILAIANALFASRPKAPPEDSMVNDREYGIEQTNQRLADVGLGERELALITSGATYH